MSGDVQPRKRKDKKRRKDDSDQQQQQQGIKTHSPIASLSNTKDDIHIHVHKDAGLGGGICAKLVFFVLLAALAALISLIILEHRGATDLDAIPNAKSRFSQLFEGFLDTNHDNHDGHSDDHGHIEEEDEHNYDHDEEEMENLSESLASEEDNHSEVEDNTQEVEDTVSEENSEYNESDDEDEEILEDQTIEESEENNISDQDDELKPSEEDYNDAGESEENEEEPDKETEEDDNITSEEVSNSQEVDEDIDAYEDHKEDNKDSKDDETDNVDSEEEPNIDKDIDGGDKSEEVAKADEEDTQDIDKGEIVLDKTENHKVSSDVQEEDTTQEYFRKTNLQPDEESDSENQSDDDTNYEYSNITNKEDYKIRENIDDAENMMPINLNIAIKLFDNLLQKYPSSPRSLYGMAKALDELAELKKDNRILEKSLKHYVGVLHAKNVPNALCLMAAVRCINRMRFLGQYDRVIHVHNLLIKKFPHKPTLVNDLAVTFLTVNNVEAARSTLKKVIKKWPKNGLALVLLGFIYKTHDNNLKLGIKYLKKGLDTKEEGVIDGRFYFHLGDALARLGRQKEAMQVYQQGVKKKVFLSKYQRSLYNVPKLEGKPWWQPEDLPHYSKLFRELKLKWQTIRDEGLSVLNEKGYFQPDSELLTAAGDWKQFELFSRGFKNKKHCEKTPLTCRIVEKYSYASGCKRGQTKFSVMQPGTHVWPHCGPTNCRLRMHLGLLVPKNTFIRVAEETRSWREGEIFIFDDSFEHEVWHNGTHLRLVLIIDFWHPDLSQQQKKTLTPI